jgi:glycosyltransferase involved in cell wall biosynthesis
MRELSDAGLPAEQCYQISEVSYRSAKSAPARLSLRFRQYVVYPAQLIAALAAQGLRVKSRKLDEGGDVCVVSTNTFYAPLLATYLHPNVVHLVYDLFPEAMIHSGKWTEGTLRVKVVRWITKQTLKRAKTNVFLGQRLKEYVESIHGQVENAAIIPIGADQALFSESPVERRSLNPQSSPTVLYCGNFGNMHDSATLFGYWKRSDEQGDSLQWAFHCSGPKRVELEAVLSELPVDVKQQIHLGGGLDQAAWIAAMESADVGLVTMVPGSETVVMPSKTYSAMMAGQAILAIAPEDSDLIDLIKVADCGWFVEPGDVDGLDRVVEAICTDPEGLLEKRQNAYLYAQAHLGQDTLVNDWMSALRDTATASFQP